MKKKILWLVMINATVFPGFSLAAACFAVPPKASLSMQPQDSLTTHWQDSLQTVTVVGHRPMYRMKAGSLVAHIRNTPLAKEPTLNDVLKHLPGMKQASDGSFEVSGLGAPTIYLNDKKATKEELSHLDIKQIEDIELITSPGSQYDATTGAVLRIVMRRRDEGVFGKLQAYDQMSEVNSNKEDVTLGWVGKKLSISGMYGYQDYRYNVHQPQETLIRAQDGDYTFGVDRHGKNKAFANSTELNLDWLISKSHEVGAQWEAQWMSGGRSEEQQQYYRYPQSEKKYYDASSQQWARERQHHVNLFHLGKWSKSLSSQLFLDYAKRISNDSQPIDEVEDGNSKLTLNTSHSDYDIYSARLVLRQSIAPNHSLDYGGEWSLTDGEGKTSSSYEAIGATQYKNHDSKVASYLQYQGSAGKWSWSAGIRYEHLTSRYTDLLDADNNLSRTYDQWFPSFSLQLNEPSWHHSLSLRTTTSRPSFSQLSGNIYYISRFQYQQSNARLQPVNTYRLTYSAQWKDFYAMLRYTYIDKPIMYVQEVPEDKPVREVSTFMNYNHQQLLFGYINWGHAFGWWRPNVSVDATYQFFKVNDHGENISYNGVKWGVNFDNYFSLPHDWQLSLSYLFDNGGVSGRVKFKPTQNWSLGANKSFWEGRLQVAFSANDLFHQYLFREKVHQHYVDFSQTEDYKLWNYRLTVTWKFNKRTGRYHGENSAQDELNRL